jgi:hypothetical protein
MRGIRLAGTIEKSSTSENEIEATGMTKGLYVLCKMLIFNQEARGCTRDSLLDTSTVEQTSAFEGHQLRRGVHHPWLQQPTNLVHDLRLSSTVEKLRRPKRRHVGLCRSPFESSSVTLHSLSHPHSSSSCPHQCHTRFSSGEFRGCGPTRPCSTNLFSAAYYHVQLRFLKSLPTPPSVTWSSASK